MTYILLAAGKGTRLHPLTLHHPKSLYKLDKNTSVLERMVRLIRKYDSSAEIVVVTGFMSDLISNQLKDEAILINNPFYAVTNSIASLWFAREYLEREYVVIINGDIVMEERAVHEIICKPSDRPVILLDSSIKNNGDYNVQVSEDNVLVMSKGLDIYYGEFAGVIKLDSPTALLLRKEVEDMLEQEMYDQWYENALVLMIFRDNFKLGYQDISQYQWTEVDCVDDMIIARKIHELCYKDNKIQGGQMT